MADDSHQKVAIRGEADDSHQKAANTVVRWVSPNLAWFTAVHAASGVRVVIWSQTGVVVASDPHRIEV